MKDFINGMGTMFTIFTVLGLCALVYFCNQPADKGYTKAQLARMDALIANLEPLSVADLGIDAE